MKLSLVAVVLAAGVGGASAFTSPRAPRTIAKAVLQSSTGLYGPPPLQRKEEPGATTYDFERTSSLGITFEQTTTGIRVAKVAPNGQADRAGVRMHDEVECEAVDCATGVEAYAEILKEGSGPITIILNRPSAAKPTTTGRSGFDAVPPSGSSPAPVAAAPVAAAPVAAAPVAAAPMAAQVAPKPASTASGSFYAEYMASRAAAAAATAGAPAAAAPAVAAKPASTGGYDSGLYAGPPGDSTPAAAAPAAAAPVTPAAPAVSAAPSSPAAMTHNWDGTTRAVKPPPAMGSSASGKKAAEARRQNLKRLAAGPSVAAFGADAPVVAAVEPASTPDNSALGTDELAAMVEELQKGIGAIDEKVQKLKSSNSPTSTLSEVQRTMKAELDKLMKTVAFVGEEPPTPGREKQTAKQGYSAPSRPSVDDERRSRSPGMVDFGQPFAGAPTQPTASGAPVAAAAASTPPAFTREAPTDRGLYAVGEEMPMPGREREYEEYQKQLEEYQQSQPAGEANVAPARAPTIDDERRNKSPGMAKNFYDLDTADFKRPYGMPAGAQTPPSAPQAQPVAAAGTTAPPPFSRAPAAPPIDDDRRNRSPGMVKNFYDTPTADFKRPHGMPAGAPAPPSTSQAPPGNQAPAEDDGLGRRLYAVGEETPMPGREREYNDYKQQYPVSAESTGAPAVRAPAAPTAIRAPTGPPIDDDRRNRSPGMSNNFYDTSTADFKRPHGMPAGATAPSSAPQAPAADDAGAYAKANAEAAARAKADAQAAVKARTDAAIKAKADAAAGAFAAAYLKEQKEIEAKEKAASEAEATLKAEVIAKAKAAQEAKQKAVEAEAELKAKVAAAEEAKQKAVEAKEKVVAAEDTKRKEKEVEAKAKVAAAEDAKQKEIEAKAKVAEAEKIDAERATKAKAKAEAKIKTKAELRSGSASAARAAKATKTNKVDATVKARANAAKTKGFGKKSLSKADAKAAAKADVAKAAASAKAKAKVKADVVAKAKAEAEAAAKAKAGDTEAATEVGKEADEEAEAKAAAEALAESEYERFAAGMGGIADSLQAMMEEPLPTSNEQSKETLEAALSAAKEREDSLEKRLAAIEARGIGDTLMAKLFGEEEDGKKQ